jgi:Flp pilus assembly protein TadD
MPANPERLKALRDLHEKDPGDTFAAYGLAMELAKSPVTEAEAAAVFRKLIAASPDYLPAYYQLGGLLARSGDGAGARRVYEEGIAVAGRAGDLHTREELQAALAALG